MHEMSIDPRPSPPSPSHSAAKRGCFPVLLMLALAAVAVWAVFTSGGPELAWHGDDGWSLAVSLGLGALCFAVMIGAKPRTGKTVVAAAGCSLLVAFVGLPVSGVALDRFHEIADFHDAPFVDGGRYLPIDEAAVHHSRTGVVSYVVWLTDFPVMLSIDRRDYLGAFGQAKRVHPMGYCVHVVVRTAGKVSRVLDEGRDLPVGSLTRCP